LLFFIFITGCAASGPLYQEIPSYEKSEKSPLIIFRRDQFSGGAKCSIVRVDGEEIGKLSNAGFLRYWVSPGEHKISVRIGNGLELNGNAVVGETSYFEYAISLDQFNVTPGLKSAAINIGMSFQLFPVYRRMQCQICPAYMNQQPLAGLYD
jgi:hypothetical protein